MLPEVISNNLASLQPGRVRYVKSIEMEFTPDGVRVGAEYRRAAIKSDHRFTYEEVDEFLADRTPWVSRLTPEVFTLLSNMHELAMTLRRRRLEAGAIELTLPEVKIDLDKKGRVKGAHVVQNTESHQIIEEFMLAANESAADLLHEKKWNFLRRIHETPDPRKLQALSEFVHGLGIDCESLESRFEIKRVVESVVGQPEERAVHYAVLRSMKKARYGPEVEGHYALHSKHYCHFTSPIRRYPDLTVHRMLDATLMAKRPADDFDQMALLGEHCSLREQRAEQAERELIKVKLLTYLKEKVGEQMDAVVTGVTKYGLFAQGIELPAEGLLNVKSLVDDTYDFEPQSHSLVGRRGNSFRLGDLIRVEIARVDPDLRELDFRLVHQSPRPKRRSVEKKRSGKGQKAEGPSSRNSGKTVKKKSKGGKRKPR
jgi:ribonuclease R